MSTSTQFRRFLGTLGRIASPRRCILSSAKDALGPDLVTGIMKSVEGNWMSHAVGNSDPPLDMSLTVDGLFTRTAQSHAASLALVSESQDIKLNWGQLDDAVTVRNSNIWLLL